MPIPHISPILMKNSASHFHVPAQPNQIRSTCLLRKHRLQFDLVSSCFNISQVPKCPSNHCFPSGTAFITDVLFSSRFLLSVFFCFSFHSLLLFPHTRHTPPRCAGTMILPCDGLTVSSGPSSVRTFNCQLVSVSLSRVGLNQAYC